MTYKELLEYNRQLALEQNAMHKQNALQQKYVMSQQIALQDKLLKQNAQAQQAETAAAYREIYDENAVNQYISQRQVAESMANLGLTDSGLNRTQQTAVLLSRGNADSRTRLSEQAAINSIEQSLNAELINNQIKLNDYNAKLDDKVAQENAQRLEDAKENADKQYKSYLNTQSDSTESSKNSVGTITEGTATYADIYKQNIKNLSDVMYSLERRGIDETQIADFVEKYIIDYNLTDSDARFLLAKYGIQAYQLREGYFEGISEKQKRVKKLLIGLDEYEKSRKSGVSFNVLEVFNRAFSEYKITEYGAKTLIPQLVANGYLAETDAQYIKKFYNEYVSRRRNGTLQISNREIEEYLDEREQSGIISHYGALYMKALLNKYTSPNTSGKN